MWRSTEPYSLQVFSLPVLRILEQPVHWTKRWTSVDSCRTPGSYQFRLSHWWAELPLGRHLRIKLSAASPPQRHISCLIWKETRQAMISERYRSSVYKLQRNVWELWVLLAKRFDVLIMVVTNTAVFWHVTPLVCVDSYQRFRGNCPVHLLDGSSRLLRKFSTCTASHARRLSSSSWQTLIDSGDIIESSEFVIRWH